MMKVVVDSVSLLTVHDLLRPLADSLTRSGVGLVADHAHRGRNGHTDDLSHALPMALWSQQVEHCESTTARGRTVIHFAVMDMETGEAYTASMSFMPIIAPGARDVDF